MYEEQNLMKFERYVISVTAIVCAGALALLAILGPLGLDIIEHKTSQSAILYKALRNPNIELFC